MKAVDLEDSLRILMAGKERPFFLYSSDSLLGRLDSLKKIIGSRGKLFLSMKANPNPHLLRLAALRCDGFDISSEREAHLLLRIAPNLKSCTISGPGKTDSFLRFLNTQEAYRLHLDSSEEAEAAKDLDVPKTIRLALGAISRPKLGFALEEAETFLEGSLTRFRGFHGYLGRDAYSQDKAEDFFHRGKILAERFPQRFVEEWEYFLGLGLTAGSELAQDLNDLPWPANRLTHLELGRACFAQCGLYAAKVLAVKGSMRGARRALIVNGGLQHFTGWPSQRFGFQNCIVRAFRNGSLLEGREEAYSVYGSLCLGNDALHPSSNLPENLRRGDWIVLEGAGAYGLTASAKDFIGQDTAEEWLVEGSRLRNISVTSQTGYHESFPL
jgi:diaminopimelate decarboxylase